MLNLAGISVPRHINQHINHHIGIFQQQPRPAEAETTMDFQLIRFLRLKSLAAVHRFASRSAVARDAFTDADREVLCSPLSRRKVTTVLSPALPPMS